MGPMAYEINTWLTLNSVWENVIICTKNDTRKKIMLCIQPCPNMSLSSLSLVDILRETEVVFVQFKAVDV